MNKGILFVEFILFYDESITIVYVQSHVDILHIMHNIALGILLSVV